MRQVQWWAPYEFDGKQYKIIINPPRRESIAAGEEWEVYPEHSPNGHIIFCCASRRLKTASGEHPFVARTAEHVQNHWVVEIKPMGVWVVSKRGYLKEVKVEGEMLSITFTDWEMKPHLFSCRVSDTETWNNRRNPASQRFGGECSVAGKRYFVLFTDDASL